jgi:hypothetical protein
MSDPPDFPQGSPQPGDSHPGPINGDRHRLAGVVLRAASARAPRELDTSTLTIPGGDTVEILCLGELLDWLEGLAVRVEQGEAL